MLAIIVGSCGATRDAGSCEAQYAQPWEKKKESYELKVLQMSD